MDSFVVYFSIFLFCASHIKPFDAADDVVFELHRRSTNSTVLKKNDHYFSKSFDVRLPTRIYIHGRAAKATIDKFRQVLPKADDSNVIIVRWTNGSNAINYLDGKVLVDDVSGQMSISSC